MCFTSRLLDGVHYDAFSVVEDVEYGIRLADAGHRVVYAAEAHVYGEMVSTEHASRSQRQRWERGRSSLARAHAFALLRQVMRPRGGLYLDMAADLLVPPLGTLGAIVGMGFIASATLLYTEGHSVAFLVWAANLGAIVLYVLRGWSLSGTGARGLLELGCAPLYVAWKLWLRVRQPRKPSTWVRTAREPQNDQADVAISNPPTN
jgi:cellulose synthase/poly-beta-1,6-N-acetylglucosamine synthase-like glycosyltransferase